MPLLLDGQDALFAGMVAHVYVNAYLSGCLFAHLHTSKSQSFCLLLCLPVVLSCMGLAMFVLFYLVSRRGSPSPRMYTFEVKGLAARIRSPRMSWFARKRARAKQLAPYVLSYMCCS